MQQSDYKYRLTEHTGRTFLLIEDLNLGNRSLTNDIERVVKLIHRKENLAPSQVIVIYKDSEGVWDGYESGKYDVVSLGGAKEWAIAAERYINLHLYGNINGKQ